MSALHVLRVFLGRGGGGGNPLGVFVDGASIPKKQRQAVAADLGFSETVFVDDASSGRIAIFTPATELPFAGHPTVGTSWLLDRLGKPVDVLRPPAGEVRTWRDGDLTWIRARAEWAPPFRLVEYATAAELDALVPPRMGDPGFYAWAWLDPGGGDIRARSFPTDLGIAEDEATGAAAVLMGARLGRPLTIRQGVGSELHVRPGPDRTVEVGGRCGFLETREYKL
ncbi:MAG TPA: PhzF family phenazine biosynthesis protein [Candidatus Limnocylindrales bacterium]|nr:PhzF family phenazine biosynthesis protein [Candidatus Limnocylindrales bacterium]